MQRSIAPVSFVTFSKWYRHGTKSIADTYSPLKICLDAMVTYLTTKFAGRLLYYALNSNKRFKETTENLISILIKITEIRNEHIIT